MSPILKKILAALAVKEVFERVQEARNPKPSFGSRIAKPLTFAGLLGGAAFLYRSGRLRPLVEQAKGLVGKGKTSDSSHSSDGNGTWTAPAGTSGTTSVGTSSTSTSV